MYKLTTSTAFCTNICKHSAFIPKLLVC